jgi:hypothetical protein
MTNGWKTLDLANDWIKHAEAKAAAHLAAAGVGGGVLYNTVRNQPSRHVGYCATALICAAALLFTAVTSGVALRPRLRTPGNRGSRLYFRSLRAAGLNPAEHQAALATLLSDPESLLIEIVDQIQINSSIAYTKHRWVAVAGATGLAALVSLAATVAMGAA